MGDGLCYNTILALKDRLLVLYGNVSENVQFERSHLWHMDSGALGKKGSYVFCCFFFVLSHLLGYVFFSFKTHSGTN